MAQLISERAVTVPECSGGCRRGSPGSTSGLAEWPCLHTQAFAHADLFARTASTWGLPESEGCRRLRLQAVQTHGYGQMRRE